MTFSETLEPLWHEREVQTTLTELVPVSPRCAELRMRSWDAGRDDIRAGCGIRAGNGGVVVRLRHRGLEACGPQAETPALA